MTKLFALLTFMAFFHSCSVKRDQKPDIGAINSDGDQIMDEEELNLGRNPVSLEFIAQYEKWAKEKIFLTRTPSRESLRSKLVLAEEHRRKGRSREEVGLRPTTPSADVNEIFTRFLPIDFGGAY